LERFDQLYLVPKGDNFIYEKSTMKIEIIMLAKVNVMLLDDETAISAQVVAFELEE
jgi:hypothetical protein